VCKGDFLWDFVFRLRIDDLARKFQPNDKKEKKIPCVLLFLDALVTFKIEVQGRK